MQNLPLINSFLISALTEKNKFISTDEIINWVEARNQQIDIVVEKILFGQLKQWHFDQQSGSLRHETGKFFSICGIQVTTNWGKIPRWQQPIINQPEIGYLGIIAKKIDGVLYFLLQAKVEPGNINNVQLSPTLQATRSNYSRVHKGKEPLYLDYFLDVRKDQVLIDQLQSEQGARFIKKRNRNIIIQIEEDIPVHDDFVWLTLGQIKRLMAYDNLVNMDTRTVISGIPFDEGIDTIDAQFLKRSQPKNSFETGMLLSAIERNNSLNSIDQILNWLTALKFKFELETKVVSLFEINDWILEDECIRHIEDKYFRVIAVQVDISNREVVNWAQPLVEPVHGGIASFIVKRINGLYHFLVQAKVECGNFDILEMAPTVQCLTGSYDNFSDVPFLEYVLCANQHQIRYDAIQSEEGGRFYHEQNRNIIIEADESFPVVVPDNFIWITLNQLIMFLKFNNYLNVQARSLIAAISFI